MANRSSLVVGALTKGTETIPSLKAELPIECRDISGSPFVNTEKAVFVSTGIAYSTMPEDGSAGKLPVVVFPNPDDAPINNKNEVLAIGRFGDDWVPECSGVSSFEWFVNQNYPVGVYANYFLNYYAKSCVLNWEVGAGVNPLSVITVTVQRATFLGATAITSFVIPAAEGSGSFVISPDFATVANQSFKGFLPQILAITMTVAGADMGADFYMYGDNYS